MSTLNQIKTEEVNEQLFSAYSVILYFTGSIITIEPSDDGLQEFCSSGLLRNLPVTSLNPEYKTAIDFFNAPCINQGSCSEIDVIENFGAPTAPAYAGYETHMMTNLHYFKDGWANDKTTPWEAAIIKPACDKDFFTYGVWWKDSVTVIFYLDGKAVHTSKPGGLFKENMYMFFDMETFIWGIGLPTIESLDDSTKNTQYVDWVRTYKLVDLKTSSNLQKLPDENRVNIFPNPVTGSSFNIQVEGETEDFTVKISDLNGKVFFEKNSFEKLVSIDRNVFTSKGIFLVNVYSADFNHIGKICCN